MVQFYFSEFPHNNKLHITLYIPTIAKLGKDVTRHDAWLSIRNHA